MLATIGELIMLTRLAIGLLTEAPHIIRDATATITEVRDGLNGRAKLTTSLAALRALVIDIEAALKE